MTGADGSAAVVAQRDPAVTAAAQLFAGPGEMRERCRALDWAATPLGCVEGWAPALRGAVRLCLESGFATVLYAGPELVLVYNDPYRASLGAAKHPAALGRPAREVWATIWAQIAPEVAQVLAGGPAVYRENRRFVLERAGRPEEAYFTYGFSAVRDEAGEVVAVHNVAVETTAQVVAERQREAAREALAAERERLRDVLLQAPTPMALLVGPEHRLELVNDAYRRVSGGGRDVTGLTFREAYPELEGQPFFGIQDRVYATGEPWAASAVPVRYDRLGAGVEDTYFDLRYEPVRDGEGRVFAILNYGVDVTEQVRARREVERLLAESERARATAVESEARYRALFDAMDEGYLLAEVLFDDVGRPVDLLYLEANPAAMRLTRTEYQGRRLLEIDPNFEPYWIEIWGRVARTGVGERLDRYAAPLDTWFDFYVTRVGGEGSRRVAVVFQDVTARKRAEAERERLLAEAEAARTAAEGANRAKSEFLAVMSHELRTPLNAIGGYAELIELGIHGPVTEAQRTALARIQVSQRHLLGLIAGVLDYSRVEAGAVTYRVVAVPVAEAVAEAEALVAPQLRAKGLGYTWWGAPPGLAVRADREKLQQILLNLLGNAVKFTHEREGAPGHIEVAYTAVDAGEAGGRVALHVRDTGEGIAPEQLERVFEPFVQVDQRLTRPHAGVGLGLAISRDLARGMGGDLTAESTVGVGSTFTLTLPRA